VFKKLIDFSSYEVLGIATTILFFIAFVAIIIRALVLKKSYTEEMEQLPLEDGTERDDTENDHDVDTKE